MDVRVGLWGKLSTEELMLLNCGLEKTLESPLDCKEIQPVHSEGDQPWNFFGRNDAKAETPVLWPPHAKSWLIGKDSDAGRDWRQEKKQTREDEMAGWHHWFDGHEFEWSQGVGDGQGGLACYDSWGRKESNMTERLNWTELICKYFLLFHKLPFNCAVGLVAKSCLTLCNPIDYSLPVSSVHGILQARILEWVAIPSSRGSSKPRDQTQVSNTAGGFFTVWATREAQGWWFPFLSSFLLWSSPACLSLLSLPFFWCQIQKYHCQDQCHGAYALFSSRSFTVSDLNIRVFNPFQVEFCEWFKMRVQFYSFACNCAVSPTPFTEDPVLSPIVYSWFLCHKLIDHRCVVYLFLGSLF